MGELSLEQISAVRKRACCLHTEQQVEAALDAMAVAITKRLSDSNPVLLCIMNGGLIVCGKLATRLNFLLQMDYLHATRYRDKTVGADLQWKSYPETPLAGRVVLVVDDILDEGATLQNIIEYCSAQGASEVLSAVLVEKQHKRKLPDLQADFVGLEVDDFYLYGYGMDYKGYLRNAAGIFAVAQQDV
jgi:hypoxanthine phosphoribosyltransferase